MAEEQQIWHTYLLKNPVPRYGCFEGRRLIPERVSFETGTTLVLGNPRRFSNPDKPEELLVAVPVLRFTLPSRNGQEARLVQMGSVAYVLDTDLGDLLVKAAGKRLASYKP